MPGRCSRILDDLSEQVEYDYADYNIYIRHDLLSEYAGYSGQAHWHRDVEFIYIYDGEMDYSVNGEIYHMEKGEGIFVNSAQIHYGFSDNKECEFLCVVFDPDMLAFSKTVRKNVIEILMKNSEMPCMLLRRDVEWQARVLDILAEFPVRSQSVDGYVSDRQATITRNTDDGKADSTDLLAMQISILRIWQELYRHMPAFSREIADGNENLSVMRSMLNHVRSNYRESITLAEVAASGGVSVSKCCALFARYLSTSPINYLMQHRIRVSMTLLRTTEYSITEIAERVGFSGSSYFSESFRRVTGMSPREYRKSILPLQD